MKEKKKGSLLSQWKSRQLEAPSQQIERVPEGEHLKLSYGQQRLWLLQQLNPDNPFYNYSEAYIFNGELHIQKLFQALQLIYDSHDILRTTYIVKNDMPIAVVGSKERLHIAEYDISAEASSDDKKRIDKILLTDSRRSFDLENGPVIRFSLYKLSPHQHILLLNLHHIATDKWSMGIFRQQLASYYQSINGGESPLAKAPEVQYQDYAFWQRNRKVDSGQMDYWVEKLSGEIPVLELPKDYPSPPELSYRGSFHSQSHSKNLSDLVLGLSSKLETTPYVLMLSVYYLLFYRYTGQKDILVGSPISNRNHKSLEKLIGFFNDTVVLRTIFEDDISFKELVQLVRNTTLEAFANKDVAFEDLVKTIRPERSSNANPFFSVMFLYHSVPDSPDFGPEVEFSQDIFDTKVAKFDLTLYVSEDKGLLTSIFEYATDSFENSTIERLQTHFALLLKGVVANPEEKISQIPMLSSFEEETFFKEHNLIGERDSEVSGIHQLIVKNTRSSPDVTAVTFGHDSITYSELDKKSNTLACKILETTKGENKTIGLCMTRSTDMIIGLVGILKAGCAYLPLDPDYPEERIKFMLQDSEATLTITDNPSLDVVNGYDCEILNISDFKADSSDEEIQLPKVKETDKAYLIYTSGSSGKPKGVPISHGNIIQSTLGRTEFYKSDPQAFLLMSSISFDSSKAGIFWTLCTGGNLVISEKRLEQDIDRLADTIHKNGVSHILMLPSLYKMLIEHADTEKLKNLKTTIVAGEACTTSLSAKHFETLAETDLYNEYGPTEATVWCIAHKIEKKDINSIPIGRPVSGAAIYLLNKNMNLVPYGSVGEIYVGGPGLSGEYLNRPDLTKSAYINNPFSTESISKLYKTGDLGRYNSDGNIEFLGRADDQVKIRGFRIELEEIENTIIKNSAISETIVIVEEIPSSSQKRLVAFLKTSTDYDEKKLKLDLRSSLPDYMVPSSFIVLDELPHLPNGKIDKKSLAKIKPQEVEKELLENDLPKSDKEIKLKKIWEEVLSISKIGINDNFFEIGGDSISSIQIIAKSRAAGIQLKPNQIFDHQTIAELAMFAGEKLENVDNEVVVEGTVALTPIQHWFFDVHKTAPNYWNQIVLVSGLNEISTESVKEVFEELVGYHDALRLSFNQKNDFWEATVLKHQDIKSFHEFDISNTSEKNAQDESIKDKMIVTQKNLSLSKGGLFMGLYFDCGKTQENKFVMIGHHLVTDMVSWNTLFSDFQKGIDQVTDKEKIKFKKKTVSIRNWADNLIDLAKSTEILDEIAYWQSQKISDTAFPTDFKSDTKIYTESSIGVHQSVLDTANTKILQNEANKAYNTKVEDLLISTLFNTITDWTESERMSLGLERHGRNTEISDLDISNTVGWFTSFFTIALERNREQERGAQLVSVKEKLRSIPNDGIGYGLLKYLSGNKKFESNVEEPQVIFNYLGVQNKNSDASEVAFEYLWEGARDPMSERTYGLELNAFIIGGALKINWSYSSDLYKQSTILKLVSDFDNNLTSLLEHCCNTEEGNYTPSDFPEADLSQDDLDSLMKQFE